MDAAAGLESYHVIRPTPHPAGWDPTQPPPPVSVKPSRPFPFPVLFLFPPNGGVGAGWNRGWTFFGC